MNSQMRRIDLFCKLVGPLIISFIDGVSTPVAIASTFAMTCLSLPAEYYLIANVCTDYLTATLVWLLITEQVYNRVAGLRKTMGAARDGDSLETAKSKPVLSMRHLKSCISGLGDTILFYVRHHAFLPSMSLSMLYLTVLSFAGQMVTYLVATGMSSERIGILRTISTLFELSATWVAPKVMDRIGAIRAGIWFLNWQIACVALAAGVLWTDLTPLWKTVCLLAGVIASRIGLWGYDLCAQLIIQEVCQYYNVNAAMLIILRTFTRIIGVAFPPSKLLYRTPVSSCPLRLPSCTLALHSSSTRLPLVERL